jgi:metallopeptidase MepB
LSGLLSYRHLSFLSVAKPTMSLTPPQPPPAWNHTAEDVLKLTKEAIEYDRAVQDKVGGLDPKECTFESVS